MKLHPLSLQLLHQMPTNRQPQSDQTPAGLQGPTLDCPKRAPTADRLERFERPKMLTFVVSPVIPECISRKILISIARRMWYLSSYLGFVLYFLTLQARCRHRRTARRPWMRAIRYPLFWAGVWGRGVHAAGAAVANGGIAMVSDRIAKTSSISSISSRNLLVSSSSRAMHSSSRPTRVTKNA